MSQYQHAFQSLVEFSENCQVICELLLWKNVKNENARSAAVEHVDCSCRFTLQCPFHPTFCSFAVKFPLRYPVKGSSHRTTVLVRAARTFLWIVLSWWATENHSLGPWVWHNWAEGGPGVSANAPCCRPVSWSGRDGPPVPLLSAAAGGAGEVWAWWKPDH